MSRRFEPSQGKEYSNRLMMSARGEGLENLWGNERCPPQADLWANDTGSP